MMETIAIVALVWGFCWLGLVILLWWEVDRHPVEIESPAEMRLRHMMEEVDRDYQEYFEGNLPRKVK